MNEWTDQEIRTLLNNPSNGDVARLLNRSVKSVECKRRKVRRSGLKQKAARVRGESLDADKAVHDENYWHDQYQSLFQRYNRAVKEAVAVDRLVKEVKDLAPTSYTAAPAITQRRRDKSSSPQSAVLLLSDTHVGKVVRPDQTLNFGGYNFEMFLARLKYVEESTLSILRDHTNTEVPELVVAMLGDMLDGALLHGVEGGLRNTCFSQFYGAGHALAQFLRNLARHVPSVRIETVVGNHTRWQNQHKMPTENRFSNLDMFLYAYVSALTQGIENIKWNLNSQPFQIFSVQNFVFYAAHGDHWRGGDRALGIPNHAVGRAVSSTVQLFGKNGQQAPHYYLAGHLHRSITLPHAIGEVIINGGFPGLDNFGLAGGFNPVDPSQRLFLVHPKFGKTASYDLMMKFASVEDPPYSIPNNFPVE